ncbi:MAG: tetratricopeptide repeat protein, partial [Gammaproteobacteria bacterium]
RKLGRYPQAREMAETTFLAYRTRFGPNHENTLAAMMSLSNALRQDNNVERALKVGNDALDRYREHFSQHPFFNVCAANVAIVLRQYGDVAAARELNEVILDSLRQTLGEKHPYTLCCAANLSNDLAGLRDYAAASELSAKTLSLSREVRGDNHPYTLACANNHAIDLIATGEEVQGQELSADTVSRFIERLGSDHPDTNSARDGRRLDCDIEPPPT